MILRLVVAVLTMLGAVPLRICTCGATEVHHPTPPDLLESESSPTPPGANPDDGPHGHDHECAAVKPHPAMSLAVPITLADTPPDITLIVPTVDALSLTATPEPETVEPRSPDPPGTPLYLTFCNLRN